jgi:putative ABC transport system permease protein
VARRIEDLVRGGPPGSSSDPDAGELLEIPAGDFLLACVIEAGARRITIVTIRTAGEGSPGALLRLSARWMKRILRGGGALDALTEIRQAARSLVRAPGFTSAAVLTLALGIGATTAVFSVANGVLLEPLPYAEQDRIVTVWSRWIDFPKTWVSEPEYVHYWQTSRSFEDLALYFTSSHTLSSSGNPELVESSVVSANAFDVLGVQPALGRAFTWEEALGEEPVIVLGWEVWQRRFEGDAGVLGSSVQINGLPFTVVGVMPRGFLLPEDYRAAAPSQLFFPMPLDRGSPVQVPENGGSHSYYAFGRLRDGVSVESARADLEQIADRLGAEGVYSESWDFRPLVIPVGEHIVGTARPTILLLLGACGLLLLIAGGNVANLTLSRAEGRMREVAVRSALGAGRGRILRQLLTESLLLSATGGALGLALAAWGIRALLAIDPLAVPRASAVALDARVVLFTVVVTALTTILFGWVPAARVARAGVGSSLGGSGRGGVRSVGAQRLQGGLVAGQMAMAVVLLASAALLTRTFAELTRVELGFDPDEVITARITLPSADYPELTDVAAFWDELLRRARTLPGVSEAGAARLLPLDSQIGDSGFYPVGYMPAPGETPAAEWQYVTAGWSEVLGIPLVAGRSFDDSDRAGAPAVMMVNEAAARRFWGDRSPLGARVATFGADTAVVVGVLSDVRHNGVTEEVRPRYYRLVHQLSGPGNARRMTVALGASGQAGGASAEELAAPLRALVREMDPGLPLFRVQTMEQVVANSVAQPRFAMALLGVFAALALTLAVVGTYGVLAHAVSLRTREIGVRVALGAERSSVVAMIVRQGMGMALLGVLAGTALALGGAGFLSGLLFQVAPRDPLTFVAVPAVFLVVAAAACALPALRASRVPPTEALRHG